MQHRVQHRRQELPRHELPRRRRAAGRRDADRVRGHGALPHRRRVLPRRLHRSHEERRPVSSARPDRGAGRRGAEHHRAPPALGPRSGPRVRPGREALLGQRRFHELRYRHRAPVRPHFRARDHGRDPLLRGPGSRQDRGSSSRTEAFRPGSWPWCWPPSGPSTGPRTGSTASSPSPAAEPRRVRRVLLRLFERYGVFEEDATRLALSPGAADHVAVLLAMGRDSSDGTLRLPSRGMGHRPDRLGRRRERGALRHRAGAVRRHRPQGHAGRTRPHTGMAQHPRPRLRAQPRRRRDGRRSGRRRRESARRGVRLPRPVRPRRRGDPAGDRGEPVEHDRRRRRAQRRAARAHPAARPGLAGSGTGARPAPPRRSPPAAPGRRDPTTVTDVAATDPYGPRAGRARLAGREAHPSSDFRSHPHRDSPRADPTGP